MANSLLELQDKYFETLVGEIIEKTKIGTIAWTALDSITYRSIFEDVATWQITVKKTPLGNVSSTTTLEMLKDGEQQVFLRDEAGVEDLFSVIETVTLQLDSKLKESLQFIQNL